MQSRSYRHMSAEARETLSLGLACSYSLRATALRRAYTLLDPWLSQYVQTHLAEGYSPEQIAGRLQRAYPDDMGKHLSAETIYAGLYVLPRGTLRSALLVALRQARKARRPRARGIDRRGQPAPGPFKTTELDELVSVRSDSANLNNV